MTRNLYFILIFGATIFCELLLFLSAQYLGLTCGKMFYVVPFYFLALTISIDFFLKDADKKRSGQFVAGFMGSITVKLLLSLAFMLVYVLRNRAEMKSFSIFFIGCYFLYTAIETIYLYNKLKSKT